MYKDARWIVVLEEPRKFRPLSYCVGLWLLFWGWTDGTCVVRQPGAAGLGGLVG